MPKPVRRSGINAAVFAPLVVYIEAVAQHGSIRRAADALHISPSSINRQIIQLERSLGMPLFERLPRGLRPTAAGEELLGTLRRMGKDFAAALGNIDSLKGLHRGHVTLAVPQQLAEARLGATLAAIRAKNPALTYSILVGTTDQIVKSVVDGDADIGVCLAPSSPAAIQIVAAKELPIGVVMRPDHPLVTKRRLKLGQCLAFEVVLPAPHMQVRKLLDQALWKSGAHIVPVIEADSTSFMRQAVHELNLIAFMSIADAALDVALGRLVFSKLADTLAPAPTSILFVKASRMLPIAAQVVLDQLKADFPFFED